MNNRRVIFFLSTGGFIVILCIWIFISDSGLISPLFLPSPRSVWQALLTDAFGQGYHGASLWRHLGTSLSRILIAFLCCVVTAVPIGLLCGRWASIRALIAPLVHFYRPLPPLAYTSGQLAQKGIVNADVIVVRRAFAESHPEQVKAYLASLNKAVTLYREQPNEAVAVVAKEFGISNDEASAMMQELIWLSGDEQLSAEYLGTPDNPGHFANVLEDTARYGDTRCG